jgi:hypothetical protein
MTCPKCKQEFIAKPMEATKPIESVQEKPKLPPSSKPQGKEPLVFKPVEEEWYLKMWHLDIKKYLLIGIGATFLIVCLWYVLLGRPGKIQGNFWLKRNNGEAKIIRSQEVLLVKNSKQKSYIIRAELKNILEHAEWKLKEDPEDFDAKRIISLAKDLIEKRKKVEDSWERYILVSPYVIFTLERYVEKYEFSYPYSWYGWQQEVVVKKKLTTIDGSYEFADVPPGEYIIYSCYKNIKADIIFEWMMPIEVTSGKIMKLDISNNNMLK